MQRFLIHYAEIGLKKSNRSHFEGRLIHNIYHAARGLGVSAVRRLYGRMLLETNPNAAPAEAIVERLQRVYGIAHIEPVTAVGLDLAAAREVVTKWGAAGGFESFAVRTRRVNKDFPHSTYEISCDLGKAIGDASGARVDLDNPERVFDVIVLNREIFLYHERFEGPGGLPVGTAGRVALLLSGGIDSPVAGERMLRRGCSLEFIHFHSAPYTDASSREKAVELAGKLVEHRQDASVHLVPIGALQQRIVSEAPSAYRVILYRRYMLRLAERIAIRRKCKAMATGESIGQVASQTLENLSVLDRTVHMPILRPLITYDKVEIVSVAREIGTYPISIEPGDDCCSFLLPPKPVTAARFREVVQIEVKLEIDELLREAYNASERVRVGAAPTKPSAPKAMPS